MRYVLMFLLCLSAFGGETKEIEDTIKQLNDDDFDVRMSATRKLGKLDPSYIEKLVRRSIDSDDFELKYRLMGAARAIYTNSILPTEDEWLYFNGELYLTGGGRNADYHKDEDGNYKSTRVFLVQAIGVDSPLKDKLEQYDVIVSINGVDPDSVKFLQVKAGQDVKVVARRYKDTASMQDQWTIPDNMEYTTMTFEVKAAWIEDRLVDKDKADQLVESLWKKYFEATMAKIEGRNPCFQRQPPEI
jgi:hypothetical protein